MRVNHLTLQCINSFVFIVRKIVWTMRSRFCCNRTVPHKSNGGQGSTASQRSSQFIRLKVFHHRRQGAIHILNDSATSAIWPVSVSLMGMKFITALIVTALLLSAKVSSFLTVSYRLKGCYSESYKITEISSLIT